MAAFECLRDIGLEDDARKVAHPIAEYSTYHRICKTMAGEEYSRAYTFGNDPKRHGDYAEASPCTIASLPQSRLEPLLLKTATQNGFHHRFDTRLLSFEDNGKSGRVESVIEDLITKQKTLIRSKYLCAADGACSGIVKELDLPLHNLPGGGLSINLLVEADMVRLFQRLRYWDNLLTRRQMQSHLMKTSPGLLHVLTGPDKPSPYFGILGIARFIKPWTEWVIVLICRPGTTRIEAADTEIMARVQELIGDDSIHIKLKNKSIWRTNECYAEQYSKGNVHCLGDAVHRHPPHNGLGSNTCIQDAFNLAWKMAYTLKGFADPSLLLTYNDERQPIGKYIVGRANDTARLHLTLYKTLGLLDLDIKRKQEVADQLCEDSMDGEERRHAFRKAIRDLEEERHGLGGEMNQWYKSHAVLSDDETEEPSLPATEHERTLYHTESTYPGFRVPHCWLGVPVSRIGPRAPLVSTRDLTGHGIFTILTGIGGKVLWTSAANRASDNLGIRVKVYSIGWGQDYEDTFFSWFEKRQVQEKGAVLVRPDRTVAWRCKGPPGDGRMCGEKLVTVLRRVLGFQRKGEANSTNGNGLVNGEQEQEMI
ncbi:MAG: hypothetical protein Q9222_002069 [Ikaeria aurantiellina]